MSRGLREQNAREKLESDVLVLLAKGYLVDARLTSAILNKYGLTPENFVDVCARDVFCNLAPLISCCTTSKPALSQAEVANETVQSSGGERRKAASPGCQCAVSGLQRRRNRNRPAGHRAHY